MSSQEQQILQDISLKPYNTFGIDVKAKYFFDAETMDDLLWIIHQPEFKLKKLILGGGSNMLLTQDFDGLVLKISMTSKWIEKSEGNRSLVSVMAGENWHRFVEWCLKHDLGGLENLSLIPGQVGSAPIQNIGAYGVEMESCFHHLEALNISNGEFEIFRHEDCCFGYRDSYFKNEGKDKYIITRVFFNLTHTDHNLNTSYGAIDAELQRLGLEADIHNISRAVINIRKSKLPDPAELGNSGSFFKNPVISNEAYQKLKETHPDIPGHQVDAEHIKVPAGWLIDQLGWKGYRKDDAGVHEKQALVLVNYGGASGKQIQELSEAIKRSVFDTFAIDLEREVNLI